MSSNETTEEAAFLRGCISNTKKVQDVTESLGLTRTSISSAQPKFSDPDVMNLDKDIHATVDSFFGYHGKTANEMHGELAKSETFARDVDSMGLKYGERIWGRLKRNHLLSAGERSNYPRQLYWDQLEDRRTIKFYIRCWIVKRASQKINSRRLKQTQKDQDSTTPGKAKKKANKNVIDLSDDEPSGEDAIASPSRVVSGSNQRIETSGDQRQATTARMQPTSPLERLRQPPPPRVDSCDESDQDSLYRDPTPHSKPTSPSGIKRKSLAENKESSRGKLKKVHGWRQDISERPRDRQQDVFNIDDSLSDTFPPGTPPPQFGRRRRHDTQDSDPNYVPSREVSIETDTVEDVDQIMADANDLALRNARATETPFELANRDSPTRSPIRPPFLRVEADSVIPDDVQEDIQRPSVDQMRNELPLEPDTPRATAQPSYTVNNSTYGPWKDKELRREAFRLLLSCLNDINEFSLESDSRAACEERLTQLLLHFWFNDVASLEAKLGDRFSRLYIAFESWMEMRARLNTFQKSTGYRGRPGEEWQTHLRSITDIAQRAQACIALSNLKDFAKEETRFVEQSFDEDLATIFDQLTMFPGCNGAEEFKGVENYNARLLQWFS